MNRLITLLLLSPTLASAASNELFITSGSGTFDASLVRWVASGPGFSTVGYMGIPDFAGPGPLDPRNPIFYGGRISPWWGTNEFLSLSLIVNGAQDPGPGSAFAFVGAAATDPITQPGAYSAPFSFEENFDCVGEFGDVVPGCTPWHLTGQGTMVVDVVPDPYFPAAFYGDHATFTFKPVPEPTTLSLFALGFVGLAMRRKAVTFALFVWGQTDSQ